MRKPLFLTRFLALFLALILALPGPALALRNEQPVNAGMEEKLKARLRSNAPVSRVAAAGAEEAWQEQMWGILAEGFNIPGQELRKRLQPNDLFDFRMSFDPESLGSKIDIYARILEVDLSADQRQRMAEQLSPLIEPAAVYPAIVVKSYEDLSRAATTDEFDIRLERFISEVRAGLPGLSRGDPARRPLERFLEERSFTREQREILRTVARRLVKAFHPDFEDARIEDYAEFLLSRTQPISLRSFRQEFPRRISELKEEFATEKNWASSSIDSLLPGGTFESNKSFWASWQKYLQTGNRKILKTIPVDIGRVLVSLPQQGDEIYLLVDVAAHEYGHFLLMEWEFFEGNGKTNWDSELSAEHFSHADWITNGLAVVMNEWFSLERNEGILMSKTVSIWFDQRAGQLVSEPAEAWVQEWGLLENLSPPIRRYVQGVMVGAIAEAVGRKVVSQRSGANPYQVATEFLAWYAKQPMEQSVPRVEEMAQAVQKFLAEQGTASFAGAEEGGRLVWRPEIVLEHAELSLRRYAWRFEVKENVDGLVQPGEKQAYSDLREVYARHELLRRMIWEAKNLKRFPVRQQMFLRPIQDNLRDVYDRLDRLLAMRGKNVLTRRGEKVLSDQLPRQTILHLSAQSLFPIDPLEAKRFELQVLGVRFRISDKISNHQRVFGNPLDGYIRPVSDNLIRNQLDRVDQKILDLFGIGYSRYVFRDQEIMRPPGFAYVAGSMHSKKTGQRRLISEILVEDVLESHEPEFVIRSLDALGVPADDPNLMKTGEVMEKIYRASVLHEVGEIIWYWLPEALKNGWEAVYRRDGPIYRRNAGREGIEGEIFADTYSHMVDPEAIFGDLNQPPMTKLESFIMEQIFLWIDEQAKGVVPLPGTYRSTAQQLEKTVQAWGGVGITPSYEGIRKGILPVFYAEETLGALPLAAKAGPVLILVASSAEVQAVESLMARLSIPADRYGFRMVSKKEAIPEALSRVKQELSERFEIYPVNPERPTWLEDLLRVLEEQGQLPVGEMEPAIQAAQDYFQFV